MAGINFEKINSVHMVGICGTGMGALAGILKTEGYSVTGSDQNTYPPMSTQLEKIGINIMKGFSAHHLSHKPELVIIGNVVRRENPEARAAIDGGIPYLSFPGALNQFFLSKKNTIAICGTHGKTTTTALVSHLFLEAGLDPSFLVGGVMKNIGSGYRVGKGDDFVIEGDEYDTAFFDKVPKFIRYMPNWAVVANIEFDHADIYENIHQILDVFSQLTSSMPLEGIIFAGTDCPNVRKVINNVKAKVVTFAIEGAADYGCRGWRVEDGQMIFEVLEKGRSMGEFISPIVGEHNLKNLLATIAVCRSHKISKKIIAAGLKTFLGIKRRQEVRGVQNGVTVIDDFAHHPTAVRLTLHGIKKQYPGHRIVAVFEPRTNTSRRNFFQKEYAESFDSADQIYIAPVFNLDDIEQSLRFDPDKLVDDLNLRRTSAEYVGEFESLLKTILKNCKPGDILVLMSNGGFGGLHDKILAGLQKEE